MGKGRRFVVMVSRTVVEQECCNGDGQERPVC